MLSKSVFWLVLIGAMLLQGIVTNFLYRRKFYGRQLRERVAERMSKAFGLTSVVLVGALGVSAFAEDIARYSNNPAFTAGEAGFYAPLLCCSGIAFLTMLAIMGMESMIAGNAKVVRRTDLRLRMLKKRSDMERKMRVLWTQETQERERDDGKIVQIRASKSNK